MSASVELTEGCFFDQMAPKERKDGYLERVLRHGGNPNLEDADGNTPIARYQQTDRKMHILFAAGADINHKNRKGETAVMAQQHNWWAYPYAISLLKAGADYRIADNDGWDLVVQIEWRVMPVRQGGPARFEREPALAQPVIDWLTNEGVNWEAARAALADPNVRTTLENLPADYRHRPWLPQRPTLKKT